ncbi:MAG TPA: Holliday junction branch migration protein RuvA [Patescibacteria group bacterium]|nr:Holliday junction branch migration protein RuvA [Patescibacteria group bacterium]
MIGRIRGTIVFRNDPYLLIDVHGIGYKVFASHTVLQHALLEQDAIIFTYTHVREDGIELYGFHTASDLQLFEQFISISGIGPKTAIGIFTIGKREEIIHAIQQADVDFFTAVPRLGRKNAQKLIIELKNKVGGLTELDLSSETDREKKDIITALISMGFSEKEAYLALKQIGDSGKNATEKIKRALQILGNV